MNMPYTPSQQFLEIEQIREGVVILKNKSLRGILAVSSLNFALLSEEEQNAILHQFQSFLNSLDFPCQIICQSRKLNILGYLERLKGLEEKEKSELLKIQISEYRKFIQEYVEKEAIMKKTFLVIIPFTLLESEGPKEKKSLLPKIKIPTLTEEAFQRCRAQLIERMEFIILGLKKCGLQAVPLTTPELIELFWAHHHPKEAESGYYPEIPPEFIY